MRPEPSLTIVSLGGGVQSSVMTLMAGERTLHRKADCAIFADINWELSRVYEHVEWLRDRLSSPSTSWTTAEVSART